jgi:hypothetical protein
MSLKMSSTLKIQIVLALCCMGAGAKLALAHGDVAPQYGGVVQDVSDVAYEIVPDPGGTLLYIEDHGMPVATAGIRGTLYLWQGPKRLEHVLQPDGVNRLRAAGTRWVKGQKAAATLKMPSGRVVVVQFSGG